MLSLGLFGSECETPFLADGQEPANSRICIFVLGIVALCLFLWRYRFGAGIDCTVDTVATFVILGMLMFFLIAFLHCFLSYFACGRFPAMKVCSYEALIVTGMLHIPIMQLNAKYLTKSQF